jgi:hypothetical protein
MILGVHEERGRRVLRHHLEIARVISAIDIAFLTNRERVKWSAEQTTDSE